MAAAGPRVNDLLLRPTVQGGTWLDLSVHVVVALTVPLIACALFFNWNDVVLHTHRAIHSFSRPLFVVGQAMFALSISVLIWRIVLALRYRVTPPCASRKLPTVAVIVPAYNEGELVYSTLKSLARSHYPRKNISIIAVDDGSQDDTWSWIEKACAEHPSRIIGIRSPKNEGKKHALQRGILRSESDVIVTVDSDTIVEPQTLRNLVSPFVSDSQVGAVAGNVRVLNREEGILPRMLDASFTYSFDFIRAGESMFRAVFCTPGALAAYRRDLVLDALDEWIGQTFLGRPAAIGEDRALTNQILRRGFHVLYQRNAVVYTKVPTDFWGLSKMYLRWTRSNIRETLVMSTFAFRRFRSSSATGVRVNLIMAWLALTVRQLFWVPFFIGLISHPEPFLFMFVVGILLTSLVPMIVYGVLRKSFNGLWAMPYGLFSALGLAWITPYALLTPANSAWLTRPRVG